MIEVAYTNIQSENRINGLLSFYPYTRSLQGVPSIILLYIIMTKTLVIFIDADARIKRVQIGDHEIKQ